MRDYTKRDPVDRCALLIARHVNAATRSTRAAVRRRLKPSDRALWDAALALTIVTGMVRQDGEHHLVPGHFNPDPFAESRAPHCASCTCQTQ